MWVRYVPLARLKALWWMGTWGWRYLWMYYVTYRDVSGHCKHISDAEVLIEPSTVFGIMWRMEPHAMGRYSTVIFEDAA